MIKTLKKIAIFAMILLGAYFSLQYVTGVMLLGEKLDTLCHAKGWLELVFDISLILAPVVLLFISFCNLLKYKSIKIRSGKTAPDNPDTIRYFRTIRSLAENNNNLTEEERKKIINEFAKNDSRAAIELFFSSLKKKGDAIGRNYAAMAACAVVLSPIGSGDMLLSLSWNFRLVHKLIEMYGIRPSIKKIMCIYEHVCFASFTASSIEEILDAGTIDKLTGDLLSFIPLKEQLLQATYQCFVTMRTCYLTQYYLTHDLEEKEPQLMHQAKIFAIHEVSAIVKGKVEEALKRIKSDFTIKEEINTTTV